MGVISYRNAGIEAKTVWIHQRNICGTAHLISDFEAEACYKFQSKNSAVCSKYEDIELCCLTFDEARVVRDNLKMSHVICYCPLLVELSNSEDDSRESW